MESNLSRNRTATLHSNSRVQSAGVQNMQIRSAQDKNVQSVQPARQKPLVLVAEGNPSQLRLVEHLLQKENMEVVALGEAQEVLDYLKTHTPTLIVLDAHLPLPGGYTGLDLCGRIKRVKRLAHVSVVLLSEHKDERMMEMSKWEKADTLLGKPLGIEGFRDTVKRLLRKSERALSRLSDDPSLKNTSELWGLSPTL